MDYRGKDKKKFNFGEKKKCAINSLKEVNCFLSNLTYKTGKVCAIKKIIT